MPGKEKDTTKWVQKNVNPRLRPTGSNPKDRSKPKSRRKSQSNADSLLSKTDVPSKKTEDRKSGKFALAVLFGGIIAVLARAVKKSEYYK